MKTNSNVVGVGCDVLFGILSVSDEDVDAIESSVGMGCGAWDQVDPKEIIAAAWNRLRLPRDLRPTPESDAVLRNAYSTGDEIVKFGTMARKMRSLERERNRGLAVIEIIEERYIDGCDTYEDWKFMSDTARAFLEPNASDVPCADARPLDRD